MSRINEAMQRAGHGSPEAEGASFDETTAFASGETDAGDVPSEGEGTVDADAEGPASALEAVGVPPVRAAQRTVARMPPPVLELRKHEERDEVAVRDVVRMLLARWRMITAIIAVSVGIAAVINARAIPIYEATARLVIEPDTAQIVQRTVQEDTYRIDYFGTQLDILRSRNLARQTLQRLGDLATDPAKQEAQVSKLAGGLTIVPAKRDIANRTVNVSMKSPDSKYAARMANGVAETYIAQNLELKRYGNRQAAEWLTERLGQLRQDVNSTASALQQYREQRDAVSLDDKQNIVTASLNRLNEQFNSLQAEKSEKQAVYDELVALQRRGAALDTFPAIANNTYIQALKSELATLQRTRREKSEQFLDAHPEMVALDAQIAVADRRLKDEIGKAVESIRNDSVTATAKAESARLNLERSKRDVLNLDEKRIAYGALQRDADSTQQIFATVQQRLKEAELSAQLQTNNVRILDAALVPSIAVYPRTQLNFAIATLIGLVLGVGLALALEYYNPRLTDAHSVAQSLGVDVLGVAPRVPALRKGRLRFDSLSPAFQESIRTVRTRILLSAAHGNMKTLAVTSTMPKEGKTVVAASLAASMAMTGRRVLLVDADLHRAKLHEIFAIPPAPGLANILAGTAKPSDALVESSISGLFLMPAGDHSSPSGLMDTEAVRGLVDGLGQVFDIIVLDCPPAMALADASIVANVANSVLFVVGSGRINTEAARTALDRLASVQAQVVGVVLNNAKIRRNSPYGYAYEVEGAV